MGNMEILTGIPHYDFDIIQPVFAIGGSVTDADKGAAMAGALLGKIGLDTGSVQANPALGFNAAVAGLWQQCQELGGDAVVGVQFQQRIALSSGLGTVQAPEIWAYGTVIKYRRADS